MVNSCKWSLGGGAGTCLQPSLDTHYTECSRLSIFWWEMGVGSTIFSFGLPSICSCLVKEISHQRVILIYLVGWVDSSIYEMSTTGWTHSHISPNFVLLFQWIPNSLCPSFPSITPPHRWLLTLLGKQPLQFISYQLLVAFQRYLHCKRRLWKSTSKLQKNESLMVEGQASVTDWSEQDLWKVILPSLKSLHSFHSSTRH